MTSTRETADEFAARLSSSLAVVAASTASDIMAIIYEAREAGAMEALLDLAAAGRVPIRKGAKRSEAHRLILDRLLGGDGLDAPNQTNLSAAIRAAALAYGVSLMGSTTPGRKRALVRVRWAVWQALRDLGYSLPAIGRLNILGVAHHSTVLVALGRVAEMSSASPDGRQMLAAIAAARSALKPEGDDQSSDYCDPQGRGAHLSPV